MKEFQKKRKDKKKKKFQKKKKDNLKRKMQKKIEYENENHNETKNETKTNPKQATNSGFVDSEAEILEKVVKKIENFNFFTEEIKNGLTKQLRIVKRTKGEIDKPLNSQNITLNMLKFISGEDIPVEMMILLFSGVCANFNLENDPESLSNSNFWVETEGGLFLVGKDNNGENFRNEIECDDNPNPDALINSENWPKCPIVSKRDYSHLFI